MLTRIPSDHPIWKTVHSCAVVLVQTACVVGVFYVVASHTATDWSDGSEVHMLRDGGLATLATLLGVRKFLG